MNAQGQYAVTVHTQDFSVGMALQGFAWSFRVPGDDVICRATRSDWEKDGRRLTFRFARERQRDDFVQFGRRVFAPQDWLVV